MRSNKLEYGTSKGPYCTTHDVKVPFSVPEFSITKIVLHQFHVDNDKDKSEMGHEIIIVGDLVVKLGLPDEFKLQFLQWGGINIIMK